MPLCSYISVLTPHLWNISLVHECSFLDSQCICTDQPVWDWSEQEENSSSLDIFSPPLLYLKVS